MSGPRRIDLAAWEERYAALRAAGLAERWYGGPLSRHVADGDLRLRTMRFDDSPAALRLWNFLLTEEERLFAARTRGVKIVGAMKDLGTVPVLAYSLPGLVAFYPDGAWWLPCLMEDSAGLLPIADSLGIGESFCPVRAMLGAFVSGTQFPAPDLLTCSAGAGCDDLSAIAQRLEALGRPILWWEIPRRRPPEPGEEEVLLPGGSRAPAVLVAFVREELARVLRALGELAGVAPTEAHLRRGVAWSNRLRDVLRELRRLAFTAEPAPLPALELLLAEALALHFCSDRDEAVLVLEDLRNEVRARVAAGTGPLAPGAVRVFWVNPVADLETLNLLEDCGGRVCGTEYLFTHALDRIPIDRPPLEALAGVALADPMVGPVQDRAQRIVADARAFGAEALVVSRIPGASHCAFEGEAICALASRELGVPAIEIEVPPVSDAVRATLATRLEALVETARAARGAAARGGGG
ncbi:MAG: 2-hydroxyacyl-CoA dehydratase family protein [Planctomycetota bacterium]